MGRTLHSRPFKPCPQCGKKGFRATNVDGMPVIRCRYCGYQVRR